MDQTRSSKDRAEMGQSLTAMCLSVMIPWSSSRELLSSDGRGAWKPCVQALANSPIA